MRVRVRVTVRVRVRVTVRVRVMVRVRARVRVRVRVRVDQGHQPPSAGAMRGHGRGAGINVSMRAAHGTSYETWGPWRQCTVPGDMGAMGAAHGTRHSAAVRGDSKRLRSSLGEIGHQRL